MSETFFHLLGPGTQPNDDSFSMNPLPITCQVNDEPSMAALEQCAHSPQVIALLNELQHQLSERQPPLGEVLAVDLLNLNADDRHFINTLLGEGEVSVRIQQADDSESEIQEAIFCGLWRVRRRHGELFLSRLCGPGNIQIRTIGYGESYINATGLRHVWHLRCTDTLKGPLLESYEICPIPEVVLAAPEDLVDSAQRLSEVCQWLAEAAPT